MFILDTDHLSVLERAGHPLGDRILARMRNVHNDCYATIVSFEEQTRGWMSVLAQSKTIADQVSAYRKLLGQLRNYCSMQVLEFDEGAAAEYQSLKKTKIRIPTMDLKIASIALTHRATLVTRNLRDFIKVPGLKLDDWTKE